MKLICIKNDGQTKSLTIGKIYNGVSCGSEWFLRNSVKVLNFDDGTNGIISKMFFKEVK
jgi:hypothetical protein